MKIVHIAAEFAPFAKVGGMADMVFGLANAQKDLVQILLPNHSCGDLSLFDEISEEIRLNNMTYFEARYKNISVILVETSQKQDFQREQVYGYRDDVERYLRFTFACFLFLKNQKDLVVHLHDWHAAFFAFLNKSEKIPTLFTIHNLAYTGGANFTQLAPYGSEEDLACLKENGYYHLLKAGLLFADAITTVSPTYAKEILQNQGMFHSLLQKNPDKLTGIINGIDTEYWNPATDPYLSLNYDINTLEKKQELKRMIKNHFGIQEQKNFLMAVVARLVPQKGPDYILEGIKIIQKWGGGVIFLGSSEENHVIEKFQQIASPSAHIELTFNEISAHLAFAAADLFFMPSIFEPCGLTQLIAMHYGTLPFVSFTGGLCDTVEEGKTGFFFENQNHQDLKEKLLHILTLWEKDKKHWKEMQINGMKKDVSWTASEKEYRALYTKIAKQSMNV